MIVKIRCNKIWSMAIVVLIIVTIVSTIVNITLPDSNQTSNSYKTLTRQLSTNSTTNNTIEKMRGVWVPYMSLETDEHTEEAFKSNFNKIVETAKSHKINALFVHIRPFADALYKSEIFPSSHLITGTQGEEIDFDPLEYMIEKTHENGMEFHGWINPYRICTSDTPATLSENSIIYELEEGGILEYDGGKYIDPASGNGRKIIIDGVKEVVKNYDVDGIQFDDYFYPTSETEIDKNSYSEYTENLDSECIPLTQFEWRKSNVNMLISGVYSAIKSIKADVIFGISPQGNISNCEDIGADVKTWCNTKGYVDYICPQIYVNFEHSVLPFDTMLKEWQEINSNNATTLCIGLALYKTNSDYDEGTWKNSDDILKSEVEYCKENNIDNFIIYDISYFDNEDTSNEVENVMSVL